MVKLKTGWNMMPENWKLWKMSKIWLFEWINKILSIVTNKRICVCVLLENWGLSGLSEPTKDW